MISLEKRVDSTLLTGLVDAKSTPDFERCLAQLLEKWKLHDLDNDHGPVAEFCTWFCTYKKDVIRDTMLLPVREQAGLGSPPEAFFTNASECINNVIKVKVDYKRNELSQFVGKLREIVSEQQHEAEKAVVGCGKYYLVCSKLEVPQTKWFGLSREQRQRSLKKFNNACVIPLCERPVSFEKPASSCSQSSMDISSASTSAQAISTSNPPVSPVSQATMLSSKLFPLSNKLGLPADAIKGIAKKAAEILQSDGAIVSAPGQPADARMVISHSGKRPHLVLPKKKKWGGCPVMIIALSTSLQRYVHTL